MAQLAFLALILWLPAVFFLFEKYSIAKSIVFAFVAAWLFLPPTQIPLSGFPDWSKMSATVTSVMLCVCLKQPQRLLGFAPRWFDLPVLAYCVIPFASSVSNGLGAYDGLSSSLDEMFRWGLPYLVGRAYLGTPAGNRQLCLGMAIGGFLYVPLCLVEIRMSPQIKQWVYGFGEGRAVDFGMRYGGYRPMVFLSTGLELGWWMCCATLAAFMLWKSGDVRRLWGYPMWAMTAGLALVTLACKATGALIQLAVGFALLYASRFLKTPVLVWAFMAIGPCYCVNRPLGIWTGEQIVAWTDSIFGAERAESLSFRFLNEEILIQSAMQHPVLGWARSGGFNPPDASGKTAVTDGLWIIVFGWMGVSGLVALNGMLLAPTALFLVRFKPRTWLDPAVAPLTTNALILPLFMLDNLSNAMLNPIYAIGMGALAGGATYRGQEHLSAVLPGRDVVGFGHAHEPVMPALLAARGGSPRDQAADRFEDEAVTAASLGRWEAARGRFDDAIRARLAALDTGRSADRVDRLAGTYVAHARMLTQVGDFPGAIHARERASSAWGTLEANGELVGNPLAAHAANLNDLAWRLIQDGPADPGQVDRAVQLAEEALGFDPDQASFWNTLGLARYRRGDHHLAIHALGQSVGRSEAGGNAFDFYYLALANLALGYPGPAADWIERAEAWALENPAWGRALEGARIEVAKATQQARPKRGEKTLRGFAQKGD